MEKNLITQTRPRRLLLCLDGVPLEVIEAAKERGLFDQFGTPARLLSPFPTMTNIALSTMLHASAPLGYECLYFDCDAREMRGGVRKYIGRRTPDKVPSSYMDELDYQEPLPFEFLIYVAPEMVWRLDFRRFRERFRRAPQDRDYFAFLKGTDGLLHIRGVKRLHVALESLDRILTELQAFCGTETEIVLFSDHGMNLQENNRVPVQTHLRRLGFETTNSFVPKESLPPVKHGIGKKGVVALPAFGLCGYAALYCPDEEVTQTVADALVELKGVDFAIHREGHNAIKLKSPRGAARIHHEMNGKGARYRYEQLDGDPLQLSSALCELKQENQVDARGYAPEAAWFAQTAAHVYPDALANLFSSLHGTRVRHTADVLVSFEDGYYYGATIFSRLARIAATHGNALRPSTSAFMMSTHRHFPAAVRATDAYTLLRG
ncbi:MAG: hypothetical protein ABR577_00070 [Pyrinomonadaceae bacterium]